MTTIAEWGARGGHASVADAAGSIYVLGGQTYNTQTDHNDVWRSADQGAAPYRRVRRRMRARRCVCMRACVRAGVRPCVCDYICMCMYTL